MSNIKITDLHLRDRVQSEDLLDAVSESVARAIKARGDANYQDAKIVGRIAPPITLGIIAYPPCPINKPLA